MGRVKFLLALQRKFKFTVSGEGLRVAAAGSPCCHVTDDGAAALKNTSQRVGR